MYRPTVRYDEKFRGYVEELFQVTDLDRNQLLRAALLFLGEGEGEKFLTSHLIEGKTLPLPLRDQYPDHGLWQGSVAVLGEGGKDVSMGDLSVSTIIEGGTSDGTTQPVIIDTRGIGGDIHVGGREWEIERSPGEVSGRVRKVGRGISYRLGSN